MQTHFLLACLRVSERSDINARGLRHPWTPWPKCRSVLQPAIQGFQGCLQLTLGVLLALAAGDFRPGGQHLARVVGPPLADEEHPSRVIGGRVLGMVQEQVLEVDPRRCRFGFRDLQRQPVTRKSIIRILAQRLFQEFTPGFFRFWGQFSPLLFC